MIEIFQFLIGGALLVIFLGAAIEYWPLTLFIVGVILVNIYTLWVSIFIFVTGIALQIYDHNQKETLDSNMFFTKIIPSTIYVTVGVVSVSLAISYFFQHTGSSGSKPCGIGTPGGC